MKILIVTPYFYPAQYFGGPIQAVFKLGKELVKRNHEIVVYTSDAKDLSQRLHLKNAAIEGMHVHYFRNLSMFSAKASRLFITMESNKKLKTDLQHFDIAYANEYTTYQNIVLHKFARQYLIPYVVQARGSIPKIGRTARKTIYDVFFGRRILIDASANVALTTAELSQYMYMGVPTEKIALIPNGLDLAEFASLPQKGCFREKFKIPEDKKMVLYLGRIHEIKGLDVLVKAFRFVKDAGDFGNAVLVFAGSDDGYLNKLKSLVYQANLSSNVIFTGPLYGNDKLAAYVDSDVVVLPSYYETFPNVVLEAYGCSKPVIASNVESISDIVSHGNTGLLFDSGNAEKLAEKILYLLANPQIAMEMGRRGRNLVESKFSINKVVDSFELLFEEISGV